MYSYRILTGLLLIFLFNSCLFPYIAADVATYVAEDEISRRVDESMEEVEPVPTPGEIIAHELISPLQEELYKLFIYVAFTGGIGYWIGVKDMEEGEWVSFDISNFQEMVTYERAFLKRDENGDEWWKVKYYDENDNAIIIEALLSRNEHRLLRYFILTPDMESPLTFSAEGDAHFIEVKPITPAGLEPFITGIEKVEVPAGKFVTRHAEFKDGLPRKADWWISDRVPGGLVKFRYYDSSADTFVLFELADYGRDATTELNSY